MLSLVPTRFETHWAHFRCSIWTYSSGRGQKFMLKQGLGPRDHTGMLSDQLRSAGHLSSSAPIASDSGRSFTGRHCSLSSATPMPAAIVGLQKSCASASYRAAVCCPNLPWLNRWPLCSSVAAQNTASAVSFVELALTMPDVQCFSWTGLPATSRSNFTWNNCSHWKHGSSESSFPLPFACKGGCSNMQLLPGQLS